MIVVVFFVFVVQPRVLQLPADTVVNYEVANLNPQSPNTVITDYYQVCHGLI